MGRATDDVDRVGWTRETFGVVLDNIAGFEYALNGTRLHVELVVAEAVLSTASSVQAKVDDVVNHVSLYLPLFWREVPVSHGPVAQILPDQHIQTTDNMSHHAVSQDDDFLEAGQNFANLFRGKPSHVAFPGHVWSVVANATS